jgi:hypothetical protein
VALREFRAVDFAISKVHCPQCDSRIAAIRDGRNIECAICDFADAMMTLSDAMIAGSVRLVQSINRVEIVLSHF